MTSGPDFPPKSGIPPIDEGRAVLRVDLPHKFSIEHMGPRIKWLGLAEGAPRPRKAVRKFPDTKNDTLATGIDLSDKEEAASIKPVPFKAY
jgi:hypothetical protein